jgi:thermitase
MKKTGGKKRTVGVAMKKTGGKKRSPSKHSDESRADVALTTETERPATFKGQRIIEVEWRGKPAEAVEGFFIFRTSGADKISPEPFEGPFGTRVSPFRPVDRLGIGVVFVEGNFDFDFTEKLKPSLGTGVEWVEPVLIDRMAAAPNDPDFVYQWGLREIKAQRGWDLSNTNPGNVVIAILDSGVPLQSGKLSHADLSEPTRFILGPDVVNNDTVPADDHGHGTHVLGIAAATRDNGVGIAGLWHGSVFVVKVFDNQIGGTDATFKDGIYSALDFARSRGARLVINYSGEGPDKESKKAVVAEAQDKGALVVAAAGNGAANSVEFPAAYSLDFDNVIGVASINIARERAPNSNRGNGLTVAAPGAAIYSTTPDYFVNGGVKSKYDYLSGTSMAAAFVSGLAALVWSKFPALTAAGVRERIASTADPVPGREDEFGRGIINAERALT